MSALVLRHRPVFLRVGLLLALGLGFGNGQAGGAEEALSPTIREANETTPVDVPPAATPIAETCWEVEVDAYFAPDDSVTFETVLLRVRRYIHSLRNGRSWDEVSCVPEGGGPFDHYAEGRLLVVESAESDPGCGLTTIRGRALSGRAPPIEIPWELNLAFPEGDQFFAGAGRAEILTTPLLTRGYQVRCD